jgi:hypothetical protein
LTLRREVLTMAFWILGDFKMRLVVKAAFAWVAMTGLALAAAGPAPLPPPDPTAKNLSRGQIQQRALTACLRTQATLQGVGEALVRQGCTCYARGTVRAMTRAEVQAFRDTGYFNDSARGKALGFVDSCNLKRPV